MLQRLMSAMTVFAALLTVSPQPASACSCRQRNPAESFAEATDVFEGRVISLRQNGGEYITEFEVLRRWKGMRRVRATIRRDGAAVFCGITFAPGASYIIYATNVHNELRVLPCSRSRPTNDATDDLRSLGPPRS
ncbi:MAG: hypothetical protein IPK60_21675 [Sandaracinaceae bacterium]|nr:hypothetical protein [Sandaracinaceae bacterium]